MTAPGSEQRRAMREMAEARRKYPEADLGVAVARMHFKAGDRVRHARRGWVGTVTGEASDRALLYCMFDGIGGFGADPRLCVRTHASEGEGDA